MSSDPRVHKPRLPKAYTDQQLAFLKGSLPEFERRSQGSIRGDAKKFALDRAQDFIHRFGLPDEFMNVEEPESRFKEQIYNWFKNTVGRTRRKLEGRPRSQKKAAEKAASLANELSHSGWGSSSVPVPSNAPNPVIPGSYATHAESSAGSPVNPAQTLISPIQYGVASTSMNTTSLNTTSMNTALSTPTTSHATATHAGGSHATSSHATTGHGTTHATAGHSGQGSSHGQHSANVHPPHTPHTPLQQQPHTGQSSHAGPSSHNTHNAPQQQQHSNQQHSSQQQHSNQLPSQQHSAQHSGQHPTQHTSQQHTTQQHQTQTQTQQQHAVVQTHNLSTLSLGITKATMRESFSQHLDASTIANMIASYIAANPSPTPLTPIVDALFDAISADVGGGSGLGGSGLGGSGSGNSGFGGSGLGGGGMSLGLGGSNSNGGMGGRSEPHRYLRLFIDASNYFPPSIVHAGVSGPLAGPRALQMQIRKYATWIPTAPPRPSSTSQSSSSLNSLNSLSSMNSMSSTMSSSSPYSSASPTHANPGSSSGGGLPSLTSITSLASMSPLGTLQQQQRGGGSLANHSLNPHSHSHTHHSHGGHPHSAHATPTPGHAHALPHNHNHTSHSLSDEMQRIAMDRQRRKDHIQWARIHAAALELNYLSMGRVGEDNNSGYAYAMGRAFSEMMARDAVWEEDEVEWVAGIVVLRAVIRTAMRGDRRQRDEYDELLRTYERRWKEIKDEARQQAVTEVLISAKEDLARLDIESIS